MSSSISHTISIEKVPLKDAPRRNKPEMMSLAPGHTQEGFSQSQATHPGQHFSGININHPETRLMHSGDDSLDVSPSEEFTLNAHKTWITLSQTTASHFTPTGPDMQAPRIDQRHIEQYFDASTNSSLCDPVVHSSGGTYSSQYQPGQYGMQQMPPHPQYSRPTMFPSPSWQNEEVTEHQWPACSFDQSLLTQGFQYPHEAFGLVTPAPTNARNSPTDKMLGESRSLADAASQQIVDSLAVEDTWNSSQAQHSSSMNRYSHEPPQHEEDRWWQDVLDGGFDTIDPMLCGGPEGSGVVVTTEPCDGWTNQHVKNCQYFASDQILGPFMTESTYPELDVESMSSLMGTEGCGLDAAFMDLPTLSSTSYEFSDSRETNDTPSSSNSVQISARSSQRNSEQDQFLIQCKEQGMSYRTIKERGNFEEAESTLRGRYRTLTKPKEERVRRPEWSPQDVSYVAQTKDFVEANSRTD